MWWTLSFREKIVFVAIVGGSMVWGGFVGYAAIKLMMWHF
jgi:hypothetical protein